MNNLEKLEAIEKEIGGLNVSYEDEEVNTYKILDLIASVVDIEKEILKEIQELLKDEK